MSTVHDRIRRLRTQKGLTQEELGQILGITKGAVQKYENGTIRNFKADTIAKLSELFRIPPVYFIYDRVPDLSTDEARKCMLLHYGQWFMDFITIFDEFNDEGKQKIIDYCNDLIQIDKYKR